MLVLVLVMLSLMVIVAVGYLSSMGTERATANAFANKTRAEQAAQAGVDSAVAILRDCFKAFPDSVTVWDTAQSTNSDGSANQGTTLYLRAIAAGDGPDTLPDPAPGYANPDAGNADFPGGNGPNNVDAVSGVDQRKVFVLPLVSGATTRRLEWKNASLPTAGVGTFVNLNARRQIGDAQGWLGTLPGNEESGLPKPVYVPWVEITQKGGLSSGATAPVVARYAFWVEDESFRANISCAGLGDNHQRADNITNGSVPLDARNVDLLGLMDFIGIADPVAMAQNLFDTRAVYPGRVFPEARAFAHATGLNADAVNALRYLSTAQSAALNLSRHGTQRLNLNATVPADTAPDAYDAIQTQVDKIVTALQFHAPNFGQRFYRLAPSSGSITDPGVLNAMTVSRDHAKIYDYKIAANIRDYMDSDCVPTCILNTGKVRRDGHPSLPLNNTTLADSAKSMNNPIWALGKDAAPFIQECAVRYGGSVSGGRYTLTTDYYIEFWNMSTTAVQGTDFGPHPFIHVTNPTRWQCNNSAIFTVNAIITKAFSTAADLPACDDPTSIFYGVSPSEDGSTGSRDFEIDLSGAKFPAGKVTVITTDPDFSSIIQDAEARNNVAVCPLVQRGISRMSGPMPTGRPGAGKDVLDMVFRTSSSSDFETGIIVGSDYGYIDSLKGALPLSWGGRIRIPPSTNNNYPAVFGGYLRGNWTNTSDQADQGYYASALGDPRTNNEQLVYTLDPTSNTMDKTRFDTYQASGVTPTLGLPNYLSVRPNRPENPWPDFPAYYADPNNPVPGELVLSAAKAPAVVANAALTSIGQLGDVFDPARVVENGNVGGSRGGGRSFKIGQHDDRWDGDENSACRSWCSWRLTDIFCTTNDIQQPGLININGVLRDNGAALRAALTGFKFQPAPQGDPNLTDTASSRLQVDALINEMKARLNPEEGVPVTGLIQTGTGPFWERGELSELPGFGRSPDQIKPDRSQPPVLHPETDLTGVDLSKSVLDRGREELFRRIVEMTTTRGNVFTVYALGQAISQSNPNDPKTERVVGTHQLKVTFRLVPKDRADGNGVSTDFHPGTAANGQAVDFDPNDPAALHTRFAKPDHYEAQVLAVSSGNG